MFAAQPGLSRLAHRIVTASFDGSGIDTRRTVLDELALAATGAEPVFAIGAGVRPVAFVAAQHLVRTPARGRTVLIGDAAHEISPIGGQGMNLGWADAGRLATALRAALAAGDADPGDYARKTVSAARVAQRRSAFYIAMGAPALGLPLAARETLIRALGSAALRPWAAGLVTMRGL